MTEVDLESKSLRRTNLIYRMYAIGAIFVVPMFVGMVLASIEKPRTFDSVLQRHLKKQLRIFWIYLFSIFGGALVLIFVYPIYVALVIVERGAREADPGITVLLAIVPALIFAATVFFALMTYVLISSFHGLSRLRAETRSV